MRIIGRLLMLLATLAIIGTVAFPAWDSWAKRSRVNLSNPLLEIASPSVVHTLDNNRWTEFELAKTTSKLRLLTNANVPSTLSTDIETPRHYAIEYELLTRTGETVEKKVHHMRSRMTRFRDPQSNKEYSSSFFLDPSFVPLSSRAIQVSFGPERGIERIRVRVQQTDAEIQSVVLRVYQPEILQDEQLDKRWQRLPYRKRQALAEKTVYSQGLLRNTERRNLLRNRMKPIGAYGIDGVDYKQHLMYVLREHDGDLIDEPIEKTISSIPSEINHVIHIPQPGGQIKLIATPIFSDQGATDASIHWIGENPGESATYSHRFTELSNEFITKLAAGLVVLKLDQPAVVSASLNSAGEEMDISPAPRRIRTWQLLENNPVEYRIDHLDGLATPIRLDIRAAVPEATASEISVQWIDAAGVSTRRESFHVNADRSVFDYRGTTPDTPYVSDVTRRYLQARSATKKIRISGPPGLLIAAYTRPHDLTPTTRVPEDYLLSPSREILQKRIPSWFQIKPLDSRELLQQKRMTLVTIQTRPPQRNADILAGHYEWESWKPSGLWKGRHIYTLRDKSQPLRKQAAGSIFRRMPHDKPVHATLVAEPGRPRVAPMLSWNRGPQAPFTLSVSVDGRTILTEELFGKQGQLRLPPLIGGQRRIEVNGAPGTTLIYMSHLAPDPGADSWLRRLTYRTHRGRLSFVYPKETTEIEVLTGKLHLAQENGLPRSAVSVEIKGPGSTRGISSALTLRNRRFDLKTGISKGDLHRAAENISPCVRERAFSSRSPKIYHAATTR